MQQQFSVADWAVFSLVLAFPPSIGIYHAFCKAQKKTTAGFLMANREMSCAPVAISILLSFQSVILILGAPAEMYMYGIQYYLSTFAQMLSVVMATILFIPLFYPLKLTSAFEYLELRYNSKVPRLTGTIINNLATLVYSGISSFSPSTALEAVSGFPDWASFILIGLICTFYTFMGGLRSVIWVNVFQSLIMLSSILVIVIQATMEVGGFQEVWKINEEWKRINFWNFDLDPRVRHTFWGLFVGGLINWTGTYGTSQSSVQRFSSLSSLKEARKALLLSCLGIFVLLTMSCIAGVSVFAFYAHKGCDPLTNQDIANPNQIIPYFVSDVLKYPGIPGLYIACLFCGAFSILSTNLSTMVTVTWEDIVQPFCIDKSESTKTWITRILVLVYGAICIGVTFLFKNLKGTVLQASLSFRGAAGGTLNGLVMLTAFFPCVSAKGAVIGSIVSYLVTTWIGIGKYTVIGTDNNLLFPNRTCNVASNNTAKLDISNMTYTVNETITDFIIRNSLPNHTHSTLQEPLSGLEHIYSLSYLWYSTMAICIVFVVGLTLSFLTGSTKPKDVDSKYMIPVFDRLFCCLPTRMLNFLHCGIEYHKPITSNNYNETTDTYSVNVINTQSEIDVYKSSDTSHM